MDKALEKTRKYFNKNVGKIRAIRDLKQADISNATRSALDTRVCGKVLDIGSGGRFDYALDDITELVALDVSVCSLKDSPRDKRIGRVVGDARRMSLKGDSFDRVVMLHLLHHLAGADLRSTQKNVSDCLKEAYRVLKSGGKAIIVDAFCSDTALKIEDFLLPALFLLFRICGKPMIRYFSFSEVTAMLDDIGFKDINFSRLDTGNAMLCPFSSSAGIPFKYTPVSHILIEGIK